MLAIRHLTLASFRSYAALELDLEGRLIALVGENGAGKTNVLEALSLFAGGRSLRRADPAAMLRAPGAQDFAVAIDLHTGGSEGHAVRLGFGYGATEDAGRPARTCRIDGVTVGSVSAFAEHLRVIWLTPEQDGLFRDTAGERRRFLDRLVLAIDPGHGSRVGALERALRDRNRLLDESPHETGWLDAIERQIAETGIAVAAARAETVARLNRAIRDRQHGSDAASSFPQAILALEGDIDTWLTDLDALEAEARFCAALRQGRARDRAAGRTLTGPHTSDLAVRHLEKDLAAAQASTGEQKALLVGLILAHARLVRTMSGRPPIILLDEIAAHFDPRRRAALYATLDEIGAQVWMTGADQTLFDSLPREAARFMVSPGRIDPA